MPNLLEQPRQPDMQRRSIVCRTMQVRADSVNEEDRSVEAVFATEQAVSVFDMREWRPIHEVLRMDGAIVPQRVPMLNNHYRFSLDDVYGSARDAKVMGDRLVGRLYFASGDEDVERAWNKVKQGHLVDVSVGYRIDQSTTIPSGQTMTVGGRQYKAEDKPLRVVTKWEMREVSLVPVGADSAAKIRSDVRVAKDPVTLPMLLRDLVREVATQHGMDQRQVVSELSEAGGVSVSTVCDLMAGRVTCSRKSVLQGFSAVLGISSTALVAAAADDQ